MKQINMNVAKQQQLAVPRRNVTAVRDEKLICNRLTVLTGNIWLFRPSSHRRSPGREWKIPFEQCLERWKFLWHLDFTLYLHRHTYLHILTDTSHLSRHQCNVYYAMQFCAYLFRGGGDVYHVHVRAGTHCSQCVKHEMQWNEMSLKNSWTDEMLENAVNNVQCTELNSTQYINENKNHDT